MSAVDKITHVTEVHLDHDVHFAAFLHLVSSYIKYQRREKEGAKIYDYDYCHVELTNK